MKPSRYFLGAFLVCFPFQVRSLIYGGAMYLTGNFNPFTSFFFYLGDVLLLLALLSWGVELWASRRNPMFQVGNPFITSGFLVFLLAMLSGVLFASDKTLVLFMTFRFLLLFVFYLMVVNGILSRREIVLLFLGGMAFQGVIAVAQYALQHSIGLTFLGESVIGPAVEGVAKMDWGGGKLIRAYGTFPHPNVLAAGLMMTILFSFSEFRRKPWWLLGAMVVFSIPMLLAFSRAGFLALVGAFLVLFAVSESKALLKFILLFASVLLLFVVLFNLEGIFSFRFLAIDPGQAGTERQEYLEISKQMLLSHPFGVGVGHFTLYMQQYDPSKLMPWISQPVHNVFMLIANEMGVQGALVFVALLALVFWLLVVSLGKHPSNSPELLFGQVLLGMLGGMVTLMLFDHYFFSLYQGEVLLVLYLALASDFLKNSEFPRMKS